MNIVKIVSLALLLALSLQANELYKSCSGCHGADANIKAMGQSKILNRLSPKEIKDALLGYQSGRYGGRLKAIMATQAKRLSREDIEALSAYIPTLR